MPFEPGKSGNPNGRKSGSRNKVTLAMEELLEGEAEVLTRKAIELAQEGDATALRICFDRLYPPRKGGPVRLELPDVIDSAEDVSAAVGAVVKSVAEGEISPEEAQTVSAILETKRKAIETVEIERRLTELERRR